jgi:class 3 adenylate cyclase
VLGCQPGRHRQPAPAAPPRSPEREGDIRRSANMVVEGEPMDATTSLPTGTVTFLFTDIEGSTRL